MEDPRKKLKLLKKERDKLEKEILRITRDLEDLKQRNGDSKEITRLEDLKKELEQSFIDAMAQITQYKYFAGEEPLFSK